mgnify:CR=1 FL=1
MVNMPENSIPPHEDEVITQVVTDSFFTTTTPNGANPIAKYLKPKETFPVTDPCLVEDWKCVRSVHDYVIKTKQYLEACGKIFIFEEQGLVIENVFVSGPTICKDITDTFKQALKLQFPNIDYNCPIKGFEFDTGNINVFAGGDIECGFRKIIQFTYRTDDAIYQQKKHRHVGLMDTTFERTFDPSDCDINGNPIGPDEAAEWDMVKESSTYKINEGRCKVNPTDL